MFGVETLGLRNLVKFIKAAVLWNTCEQLFEILFINPFSTNVPLLYALKISANRRFSDDFSGYRSGTLVENGLIATNGQHLFDNCKIVVT